MKRELIKISIAAALLTTVASSFAFSPSYAAAIDSTAVQQGMSGSNVSTIQRNLQTLGYFKYPAITGYYGPITAQAVQNYQRDYSLPMTGIVNASTQTSIVHAIVKRQMMVDSRKYIGIPYAWGGVSPSTGFDCSGFVYYLFKSHGVPAIRTTSNELYAQGAWISRANLRPGDLVFFSINESGSVSHVGFYLGGNQLISATKSAGIFVQSLDNSYWGPRYIGAKRVY